VSPYDYERARLRLLNHANIPDVRLDSPHESFCYVLWRGEVSKVPPDLSPLATDVIACLETANREMNGQMPSSESGRQNARVLEDVAYAVSGIIASGIRYHRRWSRRSTFDAPVLDAVEDATYCVALAWDQVLAGDVDELRREIDWALRTEQ
ncbi:MAG TPA: hypothetical protein VFB66_30135, partial [Tepidisphaeraceae bacterium]|nr:hypothetical protein [Tepidisphaeraceae bacterium]